MNTLSVHHNNEHHDSHYKGLVTTIYLLQALAFLLGGIPFLLAVILNYTHLHHVKGTWLESHFIWQINTFWVALLLAVVGAITLSIGIGIFILLALTIWVIHRITYGWMTLNDSSAITKLPTFSIF